MKKKSLCRYIQARLKPSTLRHSLYNALIKPLKWISNYLQFLNEWIQTFTKFLLFYLYQPMLSMSTISDHFAIKCFTNKLLFFLCNEEIIFFSFLFSGELSTDHSLDGIEFSNSCLRSSSIESWWSIHWHL